MMMLIKILKYLDPRMLMLIRILKYLDHHDVDADHDSSIFRSP
jgi:hypothetical protein